MMNFKAARAVPPAGYWPALWTLLLGVPGANAQSASVQTPQNAAPHNIGRAIGNDAAHSDLQPDGPDLKGRSFLSFTNRRDFNKTFGSSQIRGKEPLLKTVFESGIVVAVVKRDSLIWNYKVRRVVGKGRSAWVYYNAKSVGTPNRIGDLAGKFASPLIVALDGRNYTSILFVENGQIVGKVAVDSQPSIPQKMKGIRQPSPMPPQKIKLATMNRALIRPVAGAGSNQFFEGTYRVGATSCVVNPIKMAFAVKWAHGKMPQTFFADSLSGNTPNRQRIYRAEESGGSSRFVFDDARFQSGRFIRADGKVFPVRKTSKPRPATRQVFVFLVAVGDGGKIGRKFGCDDSLVAVSRSVSTLESPLKAALQELISLPPQLPENPKLQNFWKGRNLQIQTVSVRGGVARIQIAGEVFVAGVCDEPRITTQIEATARQFHSVKRVKVFIGGQSLKSAIE